jgi:L-amino acid N-acyltransferase YncA
MIRLAKLSDINAISKIYFHPEVNPFLNYKTSSSLRKHIKEGISKKSFFVFIENKKIIGHGSMHFSDGRCKHTVEMCSLGVHPDHRRKGIATKLFKHRFQIAKKQGAKRFESLTQTNNKKGIQFHEKLGFKTEGRMKRIYFQNGKYGDYYLMAKLL